MLLLANIHTYDVLTVACVWTAYLIVLAVVERAVPTKLVLLSALAALIAMPSIAYQLYVYHIDEVFRLRANTPTPSPAIWSFFSGYGLVLVGALAAIIMVFVRRRNAVPSFNIHHSSFIILTVWSVVGFAMPCIPVAQQRKLVMGLHIPLCILCAYALTELLNRAPRSVARGLVLALILFTFGSNARFLSLDTNLLRVGRTVTTYLPFISDAELSAMRYLREHTEWNDKVFAPPGFALFVPAIIGHQVYYGHWSETPDYDLRYQEWQAFVDHTIPVRIRGDILTETGASYYASVAARTTPPVLPWITRVFAQDQVSVYQVGTP